MMEDQKLDEKKDELFGSFGINKYYPLFFSLLLILITFQYSFSVMESFFYDLRIKLDFGYSAKSDIVIVTLDEESDGFLGESYPYSYSTHLKFLERLKDENPRVLNYYINFQAPESFQQTNSLQDFSFKIKKFQEAGWKVRIGTEMDSWGEIIPPDPLKDVGYSLGLINTDSAIFAKDDVSRRAILNISGDSSIHLWTANAVKELGGEEKISGKDYRGSYYNTEADATFALFRYFTSSEVKNKKITQIPFHRAVVGNFEPGFFKNKIVLIGPEYSSNPHDFVATPFSKNHLTSPKMNLHAMIIQALIKGKTVWQLPQYISNILCLIMAFLLSYFISKYNPTKGLVVTLLTMVAFVLLGFALFSFFGIWVYLSHFVTSIFIIYYIWVPFRAIIEYQHRYKIQQESELLKKVDNLKQNFISLMSHDLKTPVAKIAGVADILLNQYENDKEQKKYLRSIITSTGDLNKFITSILDLTKIESRNLKLDFVSRDINTLLENVVSSLKFEASSKNVKIDVELAPLYPIKVDENLINRVFTNLIENAIKYSGEGSIIEVKSFDDEEFTYVSIKDNGVGISKEDAELIFDKFYRVKNDASHKIKGSGLGLYLVKYFIELHEGSISVESEIGEGTTFNIKLKNA